MDQLKESFQKVLRKDKITRQDLIPIKHRADHCNPQISTALAHILENTKCELPDCKIKRLKDLYKKIF